MRLDTTDLGADAAAGPSAATLRADILVQRGQPDAALRTLTDEVVPAASRVGDAHLLLVGLGRVADVHMARGRLDEALRILREELLPTLERLGDTRQRVVTLARRAHPEDLPQIRTLLAQALHAAPELHLPEAAAIETLQKPLGLPVSEVVPD